MLAEPTGFHLFGSSQGIRMNRTFLLVSGAICWTVVGADVALHLAGGDLLAPVLMATVFVLWVGLRRLHVRQRQTA